MKAARPEDEGLSAAECLIMYKVHLAGKSHNPDLSYFDRAYQIHVINLLSVDRYELCEHLSAVILFVAGGSRFIKSHKLCRKLTEKLGISNPMLAFGAIQKAIADSGRVNFTPEDDIGYFTDHPSAEPMLIAQLNHAQARGKLMGTKLSNEQKGRLDMVCSTYLRLKDEHTRRAAEAAPVPLPHAFETLIEHRPETKAELERLIVRPDLPLLTIDVSLITDMSGLFAGCTNRRDYTGIEFWDVSNVTDMRSMFDGARFFNQPIGMWDVSKVRDMSFMFTNTRYFNQPLGSWDVSSVEDMSSMFLGAREFNQPLEGWDVSGALFMSDMFYGAYSFSQSLEGWEPGSAADISGMFTNCGISVAPSWFSQSA